MPERLGTTLSSILVAVQDDQGSLQWQERANCLGVNPDIFYSDDKRDKKEAKAVCNACEVRIECLDYSLVEGERFGIWGGLDEGERRNLKRQRTRERRRLFTKS